MYKAAVKMRALVHGYGPYAPPSGPVDVTVHVFRPRKAGDLDNALKVLLDALSGIAYVDDDQVVSLHAFRHDDKERPRVEVEVEPVVLT